MDSLESVTDDTRSHSSVSDRPVSPRDRPSAHRTKPVTDSLPLGQYHHAQAHLRHLTRVSGSYFAAMFGGPAPLPLQVDGLGATSWTSPTCPTERRALVRDAEFYPTGDAKRRGEAGLLEFGAG
eukprot:TRINITY_DN1745_c0_g2_i2.p4 TRINITY_DN1745_c0_g2~~TRINITY_DN1745_c0_g2_i2.p4  ORF type:complete len:124 (+),score=7.35 TRINITY_DN1745_c0_g2_i2:585-956(+)